MAGPNLKGTDNAHTLEEVDVDLTSERVVPTHDRYRDQAAMGLQREQERIADVEARRLPERPAQSADKAEWVDYCVALGADKRDLTKTTKHNVTLPDQAEVLDVYVSPEYTKDELVDLADRLGG